MKPLLVFIDMDDTLCDFSSAFQLAIENTPSIAFPQSQFDFFRQLQPISGAIDAMKWMLAHEGIEPHILTAPSAKNPLCYTEKRLWVADHLGDDWLDRLHISPRKDFFRGDILIDDMVSGRGQERFSGRLLHFGSPGLETWDRVKDELKIILALLR